MPRWESDGRERLEAAALELFLEVGYEATTVAAIAKRAGLTERSFYRHFADKREALFSRDDVLIGHLTTRLGEALQTQPPYAALLTAMSSAEEVFLPRDALRARVTAVANSVALVERERSKLAALADALAAALQENGSSPRTSRILADLGLSILVMASNDRIDDPAPFAELVRRAAEDQRRAVTDGALSAGRAGTP
jgi:AcrR family transcriptional regulator